MELSYRGAHYQSNEPEVDITDSNLSGKYRGANWQGHAAKRVPQQSHLRLTYRGKAYTQ